MSKVVRTARGEMVNFDAIIIKQQLAKAPMNIEVARRKQFIDSKEGKPRGQQLEAVEPSKVEPIIEAPVEAPVEVKAKEKGTK